MTIQLEHEHGNGGLISHPIKALLLDDSDFDRKRIRRMTQGFGAPIDFYEVPSIDAMASKMDREKFDLILIDFQLPEGDGLQALDLIQGHATNKSAAKIMITGQQQTEVAVSAFRQGCHDFITKDELSTEILKRAMQSALRQTGVERFRETILANEIQQQIQAAVHGAITHDLIQATLTDGLKRAVRDINLNSNTTGNSNDTQTILSHFFENDVFDFVVIPN